MINVNEETIKAYTEYGCRKNITIFFPDNPSIPAITNKNLQEESMKIIEGICEENTLQVGGCNSTQFEITTFDIQEDITNKNIVVSLSARDDNYKGEWNYDEEYSKGDIVKFNNSYYEYFSTPPSDDRGKLKRINVPPSEWTVSSDKKTYRTKFFTPDNFIGIRIDSSSIPDGVTFKIRTKYVDAGYYYVFTIDNNMLNKNRIFPKINTQEPKTALLGWYGEIVYDGDDVNGINEWVQSLNVYSLTYIPVNKLYPTLLSEYCEEIYGYIDTSDVKDFTLFRGKVYSFEKQTDPRYRTLVAYDKMYELENISIKEWINTLDASGKGYIEKYHYRGEWKYAVKDYKAGDVVYRVEDNNMVYYHYKKDMDVNLFQNLLPGDVANNIYPPNAGVGVTINGDCYIEKLSSYYPNRPTVKTLRTSLCHYLKIQEENVTLPLDNMTLTIGKFEENTSARQLFEWICNLNMVFGYIDPRTETFRYIFINKEKKIPEEDSNYKGKFNYTTLANNEVAYKVGDVVSIVEYNQTYYYRNKISLSQKVPTSYTELDIKNIFMNVARGVRYRSPKKRGDDWYIHFDFDKELAQELDVTISVSQYKSRGKQIVLKLPGDVYLPSLIGDEVLYTIMVNNVNDEFWETFQVTLYVANGLAASKYPPQVEEVSDFWEKCNALYHPSGQINLSSLYENDSAVIKDNEFRAIGYNIVDINNNVIEGADDNLDSRYLNIIYSPLYNKWKSTRQLYIDVNENVGYAGRYFTIEYTPFTLSLLGLPFLEPGDYVCFDVIEWSTDENDNPVQTIKTVESIILCRELSGINALTDNYEARYE